ncbi:hypothetical protein ACIRJO_31270 [Streptomyces sp. NPDC102394]|uniref:hypothetical protein n=1 Tax=Streptomyces sp. NPDC102394 TaxID=3366167 RepID=UPI00382329DB
MTQTVTVDGVPYEVLRVAGDGDCFPTSVLAGIARQLPDSALRALDVPQLRDRVAKWLTGDSPEAAARRAELDAGPDPVGVLLNDLDLPALETLLGEPAPELPREEVERIEQNLMRPQYLRALIDQFANPADRAIVGGFTPGMAARFLPGFVPDREKIDKASLQRLVRDRRTTRLRDLAAERLRTGHPSSQVLYQRLIARHPSLVRVYPELAVMLKTPTSEVVALAVRSTDMWTSPFYDRMPELTAAALDLNITTVQTFEGMSDLTLANRLNPAAARSLHVFYEGGVHYSAMNRVGGPAPAEQAPVISQASRLTESPVVGLPPAAPWDVDANPGLPLLEGALRAAEASESLVARLGGLSVAAVNQLNRMHMAGPQQNAAISAADVARARRKGRSTKPRATAAPVTVPFTMGSTEISEEQRHRLDELAVLVAEQARTSVLAGVSLPVVRLLGRGRGARFAFARRSPRDVARSREEAVERHLRDRLTQALVQQPSARHPLTGDDFRFEAAGDEQPSLDDVDTARRDGGEVSADSVDVQVDFTPEPTRAQEEIAPELIAAKWAEVEHRVNPRRAVALSLAYHIVRTHQRVTGFQPDENPQFGELPLAHRAVYAVAVSLVDSPGDVDGAQALSRALAANQPAPSAPADTRGRDGGRSSRWTRDRSVSASRSASRSGRFFPAPSSAQPGAGGPYRPMPAPVNSTSPRSTGTGGVVFTPQPLAPVTHHQHHAPAGPSAHGGPSVPAPSTRALRLSNDLPSMDARARAMELAALHAHERRWLSSHPELVDNLKNALSAEEFALAAVQLLVHVPEAVRRPASARQEAHALLSRMLRDPDVTAQMLKRGANVVVVPKDVPLTTLEQFEHLRGQVHGDGRITDFIRGIDHSSTAVPEENLLGERSLVAREAGTVDPDGYSVTVHEFAHAIHRNGLTRAEQQQIKKAYDDRRALGAGAQWPDGPRLHLNGVPTDNYSAKNEYEYFAQLTNVYFGVNTGQDASTLRPRENGAEWVTSHERALLPLLQRLYGPPEEAGFNRPVNPLQSNLREDEVLEGVRALFRDDSHPPHREQADAPPDADELVRELPLLDDEARAHRLAALKPAHRRWLAGDTALVDELSRTLSAESFADTAAQLMVEVLPGADRPVSARQEAQALLARVLRDPRVAARLLDNNVVVRVLPRNVPITALPQYQHLSGRTMPNGRPFAGLRELHGRATLVPEENLLGDFSPVSFVRHPQRYSSAVHAYAQTVYTYGLTDAERDWIEAAYQARQRRGTLAQWPRGTQQDTPSAQAYFAQLTSVYLGVNGGRDVTGRPLPNGPQWVLANESVVAPLLTRLYGPVRSAWIDRPVNPVHQTLEENTGFEGVRALFGDGSRPHGAPQRRSPDAVVPGGRIFATPPPTPAPAADLDASGRGPEGAPRTRGSRPAESRAATGGARMPVGVTESSQTAARRLPPDPLSADAAAPVMAGAAHDLPHAQPLGFAAPAPAAVATGSLNSGGAVLTRRDAAVPKPAAARPADEVADEAARLVADLLSSDAVRRARALAEVGPQHRSWLASYPDDVHRLGAALTPEEFAQAAAQVLVDVPEGVRRPIAARQAAHVLVARMLRDPDVAARLLADGSRVVVVPADTPMTELEPFRHLQGEPAPGGRTWDQVRGSGGHVTAITEENLLGESSPLPNTRYADGYSTTVHELAHMVHHHGLSQADRQAIDRAFAARRALGPDASWPDGIRRDREGRVTDNYSSRDAEEFFAQLSNVYLGVNTGLDPFTGRPRENGARWVEENEPGLLPLLRRLYGPAPQEGELGPVNPVRAVREEDETLAAVRLLFHGEQVVAPDSWTEPRATASWTGRDRSESSHDKEQLPPPPPSGMTHLMPVSGTPVGDLAGWPGPLSPAQREEVLRQVGTFLVTGRLSAVRVVLHRLNRRSDRLRGTQYEDEAARLANRVAWDLDRAERGPGLQSPPKVINFFWIGRPMSGSAVTNVLRWAELARQHGWIVQMWTDTAPVSAARPAMLSTWDPAVFQAMEAAGVRFRAVESLLPPDRPAGWKNGRFDRGFTLQNPRMLKLRTMYNNARLHPGAFPVASDLVRIGIMLYEGGAYFDVDMEPGGVELFTEARKMGRTDLPVIGPMFRDARVFAGQRADFAELLGVPAESVSMEDVARYAMRHAMFGNAFMMAVPGSRFFERAIDAIGDEAVQWNPEALATSGAFLTGPFLYHRVAAQQVASYGLGEVTDAETGAAMDQQELGRWARLGWLTAESENQVDRPVGQAPIPSQNSGDDIRSRLGRGPRNPRGGAGSGASRSADTFAPPPSESETRTPGRRSGLADGLSGVPVTGGSVFVQRSGTPSPARRAAAGAVTERSSGDLASEIRAATGRDPEGESESAPETRTAPDALPPAGRQPLTVPFARGSRTVDAGQDQALRELARTLAAEAVRNRAEGLPQQVVRVSGRGNSTGHASFTGRTRAKNTAWILEAHLAAELRELQGAAPDPVTVRDLDIRYGYEDTSEQKRLDPHDRRTATVTVGAAAAPEGVAWTPLREPGSPDRHELAETPLTVTFGKGDKDVSARDSRHIEDLAKRIAVRAVRDRRAGLRPPVIRIPGRGNGPDAETTGLLRADNTRRELEKFLTRELQRLQQDDSVRPLTPADFRIVAEFDDAPKALYQDPLTHRTATIRVDWPAEGTPEPEEKPLPPLPPVAEAEDKALPPMPPTSEPGNQEDQVEEASLFAPEWGEEDDSRPVKPLTTAEERVRTGVVRQGRAEVTVVAPWQTGEDAAVHGTVIGTEAPFAGTSVAAGTGYTRGPAPDTVVGPAGTVLELRPVHGPGNGLTEAAMRVVGDDLPDWFLSDGTPDQDIAVLLRADLAAELTEADLPEAFPGAAQAELTATAEELARAGVTLTERPDGVIRVGPADLTPLQYTRLLLTRPEHWDPAVSRIAAAGLARLLMLDLTVVDLDTGTESRFSGGLSRGVLVRDGGRFRLAVPRRDTSTGTPGDDTAGTHDHPSTHP